MPAVRILPVVSFPPAVRILLVILILPVVRPPGGARGPARGRIRGPGAPALPPSMLDTQLAGRGPVSRAAVLARQPTRELAEGLATSRQRTGGRLRALITVPAGGVRCPGGAVSAGVPVSHGCPFQ